MEVAGRVRVQRQIELILPAELEARPAQSVVPVLRRGVAFGQIVYGGDLVIPEGWDHRSWVDRKDDRLTLFSLAADALVNL